MDLGTLISRSIEEWLRFHMMMGLAVILLFVVAIIIGRIGPCPPQ